MFVGATLLILTVETVADRLASHVTIPGTVEATSATLPHGASFIAREISVTLAAGLMSDAALRSLVRTMVTKGADGYSPLQMPRAKQATLANAQTVLAVLASERSRMGLSDLREWTELDSYALQSALRHLRKIGLIEYDSAEGLYRSRFLIRGVSAYAVVERPTSTCAGRVQHDEALLKTIEHIIARNLSAIEMDRFVAQAPDESEFVAYDFSEVPGDT